MSMRISSLAIATVLLAGCSGEESPPPDGDTVACAIGAGADFAEVCTLEKISDGDANFLLHTPDGSFRRLMIDPASGEFGSVDGADVLEIVSQDGELAEFRIAEDRYRIPHRLVRKPAKAQ